MDAWVIVGIILIVLVVAWIVLNLWLDAYIGNKKIHIYYVDKENEDSSYSLVHWENCWCKTGESYEQAYWRAQAEFKTVISTTYLTKAEN